MTSKRLPSLNTKLPPDTEDTYATVNKSEKNTKQKKKRDTASQNSAAGNETETSAAEENERAPNIDKPVRKKKKTANSLSDRNGTDAQNRHKTRQKSPAPLSDGDDEVIGRTTADEEDSSNVTPAKRRKRKRKAARKTTPDGGADNLGLAAELYDLKDDVVTSAEDYNRSDEISWKPGPTIHSVPTEKLYIEQRNGFKSTNKDKIARQRTELAVRMASTNATAIPLAQQSTIEFALWTHKGFKMLTLILQGLFAGIALWHVVSVWTLSSVAGFQNFLQYYSSLAMPVQCMYYFLFAVCTVAVFDRYDIARLDRRFVIRSLTLQTGTISCLFYFIGLIFSLAIAPTDDKMWLYSRNSTLWSDTAARDSQINEWLVLNLLRALGAILGWLVIALQPMTDRLSKNLRETDENRLEIEGMGVELPATKPVAP